MCGPTESKAPTESTLPTECTAPTKSNIPWYLALQASLAKKTDRNITARATNNRQTLLLSNISEDDLKNLPFITTTDQSSENPTLIGFRVNIKGDNGFSIPIHVPGLAMTMAQAFRRAGSDAFLLNWKTFTPFKNPFNNDKFKTVGDFIDTQSSINNSLVSTVGKNKTYTVVYGLKSENDACPNSLDPYCGSTV
jgi:hypothetical protein